jgi:hypothetical protein
MFSMVLAPPPKFFGSNGAVMVQEEICFYCKTEIHTNDRTHMFLRVCISKRKRTNSRKNTSTYFYRAGFAITLVCEACYLCMIKPDICLQSNVLMRGRFFDFLDMAFRDFAPTCLRDDYVGELVLFQYFRWVFANSYHKKLYRFMGKLLNACGNCQKASPSKRCKGCYYVRYCNEKCANCHWKIHSKECRVISKNLIFLIPSELTVIKK